METTPQSSSEVSQPHVELSRREKIARRLLPAVALSLAVGGYAAEKIEDKAEYHEVATVVRVLGDHETPIDAVRKAVAEMTFTENGKPVEISGIVREGQDVARELQEQTGETYMHAGDTIEVTVSKNGFGDYKLDAHPADTAK